MSFLDRFTAGGRERPKPPKARHVVRSNTWDARAFTAVRQARYVDSLIDELMIMEDLEYAPELVHDMFMLAYKGYPQLRPKKELDKQVRVNKQIVDILADLPDLSVLQQYSGGDAALSLLAIEALAPHVKQLLDNAVPPPSPPDTHEPGDGQPGASPPGGDGRSEPTDATQPGQGTSTAQSGADGDREGDDGSNSADDDGEGQGAGHQDADGGGDEEWSDPIDPVQAEEILSTALAAAKDAVGELKDAELSVGSGAGDWAATADPAERIATLQRIGQMKKLLDLVGRMTRFAAGEYASRITPSEQEMYGVELGNSVRKILSNQFALLGHDTTKVEFYRRYAQRELLQWRMRGTQKAARGPVVILVDKSESMHWGQDRMSWALACTESMRRIAAQQTRDVFILFFDSSLSKAFHFPNGKGPLPQILDVLSVRASGGTSFEKPCDRALDIIRSAPEFSRADVVLITDGAANPNPVWIERFTQAKADLGVRVFGVFIGSARDASWCAGTHSALGRVADHVIPVTELTIDAAQDMFREF